MKIATATDCFWFASGHVNSLARHCCWFWPHYVLRAWVCWLDWSFIAEFNFSVCISVACVICHTMAILMITKTSCMHWTVDSRILRISTYYNTVYFQFSAILMCCLLIIGLLQIILGFSVVRLKNFKVYSTNKMIAPHFSVKNSI